MQNTNGPEILADPDSAPHHDLTPEDLRFTPPVLDKAVVTRFVERYWALQGVYDRLPGERDQNFSLRLDDGRRYVVKIASPIEDPSLVDYQVKALLHVARVDPDLPTPRILPDADGNAVHTLTTDEGEHAVRLLSWVPGRPLSSSGPLASGAVAGTGRLQGLLCNAFADFDHPAKRHFMPWDALNGLVESPALRHGYMPEDLERRCAPHLERLEHQSLRQMRRLPAQVIHNDAHRGNILCDADDPAVITGAIDFGDLAFRPRVTDLATSLTSFIGHDVNGLRVSATLLKGFRSVATIGEDQLALLYDALLARAIMTVQLLTFRARHTDAPESVRTVDLVESVENLEAALRMNPEAFLEAVST